MRENFELNFLIHCEPMKRFQNGSDMMKFWSSSNGSGSRIENKLKTINLSSRKIEQKRVAVVDYGVNETSSSQQ